MFSRKARHIPWKRTVLLTVLVVACSATVALAMTMSSSPWTVIFGTTGNDTINQTGHAGNYRIYGFLGKDTLTGGTGDNVLVGDGHCPPGTTNEQTIKTVPAPPNDPANHSDQYCDVHWSSGDGGDTLTGGGGNNAIFGGGGPNRLTGGKGNNFIEDGPSHDTIYGGPLGDVIDAVNGPSTIYPGKGTNYIDTVGPGTSYVYCTGKNDYVSANQNDVIKNCAHVYYQSHAKNHGKFSAKTHKKHKGFRF
jgi:RTX calcium-binding nonapeptide repeat (4 copies)